MTLNPAWLGMLRTYAPSWTWAEVDATTLVGARQVGAHMQRLVVTAPLLIAGVSLPVTGRLVVGQLTLTHAGPSVVPLVRELERQLAAALKRGAHTESDEIRVRPYAERYGDLT